MIAFTVTLSFHDSFPAQILALVHDIPGPFLWSTVLDVVYLLRRNCEDYIDFILTNI
jgi:hypothetical protein